MRVCITPRNSVTDEDQTGRRSVVAATHRAAQLGARGGLRRPGGRLAHGAGGEANAERLVKAWATVSSRHLRLV